MAKTSSFLFSLSPTVYLRCRWLTSRLIFLSRTVAAATLLPISSSRLANDLWLSFDVVLVGVAARVTLAAVTRLRRRRILDAFVFLFLLFSPPPCSLEVLEISERKTSHELPICCTKINAKNPAKEQLCVAKGKFTPGSLETLGCIQQLSCKH